MDLIVPLSSYSFDHKDEELRYMLRSVLCNFKSLGKIFIVGHRPNWLKRIRNVEHISVPDFDVRDKDVNIINKILAVCRRSQKGEFLVNSDDQIFCRPVSSGDLRRVWLTNENVLRDAEILAGKSAWHLRALETLAECRRQGWPELLFEVHIPYVVDSLRYRMIMDAIEGDYENGLLTHIYFNAYLTKNGCSVPQPEKLPEHWFQRFKWQKDLTLEDARDALMNKTFVNFDDVSYTPGLRQALEEAFTIPAPWEEYGPTGS